MSWLEALQRKHRRGSLPRCLLLTDGERPVVAGRLTTLVGLDGVHVGEDDFWMPCGLPLLAEEGNWDASPCAEARLGKVHKFLTEAQRKEVLGWWLARRRAQPPNWDIASTATIDGQKGLILVESKAHTGELKIKDVCSSRNPENQASIGAALQEASDALEAIVPGWKLSKESHYQLANRFAWSWKIASLGVPVVLVYLGFLNADEMRDKGEPFADPAAWEACVRAWSRGIVPEAAWSERLSCHNVSLWALVRSVQVDLDICQAA